MSTKVLHLNVPLMMPAPQFSSKMLKNFKELGFSMSKVCFLSFLSFRAFKSPQFCQKRSLIRFPPSGKLTK